MLTWQSETQGKETYEIAMLNDRSPVIHYELRGNRYRIYHILGNQEKIIQQGRGRARAICEAHASQELGLDAELLTPPTPTPRKAIDALEREGLSFRQQFRLYGSLMLVLGLSWLSWWQWFKHQPLKALLFVAIWLALWLAARQLLRVFRGELGLRQSLNLTQKGQAREVKFHAKR